MRALVRHVHQSLVDDVTGRLSVLGWRDPGGSKTRPVDVVDYELDSGASVAPPAVAISIGSDSGATIAQLGGGLITVDLTFFIDVYGEKASQALHLAQDIIDGLVEHYVPVFDYSQDPPALATDVEAEVYVVRREVPQVVVSAEWRRHWQVVKGVLRVVYAP
jgi:hypothetical protein